MLGKMWLSLTSARSFECFLIFEQRSPRDSYSECAQIGKIGLKQSIGQCLYKRVIQEVESSGQSERRKESGRKGLYVCRIGIDRNEFEQGRTVCCWSLEDVAVKVASRLKIAQWPKWSMEIILGSYFRFFGLRISCIMLLNSEEGKIRSY